MAKRLLVTGRITATEMDPIFKLPLRTVTVRAEFAGVPLMSRQRIADDGVPISCALDNCFDGIVRLGNQRLESYDDV